MTGLHAIPIHLYPCTCTCTMKCYFTPLDCLQCTQIDLISKGPPDTLDNGMTRLRLTVVLADNVDCTCMVCR